MTPGKALPSIASQLRGEKSQWTEMISRSSHASERRTIESTHFSAALSMWGPAFNRYGSSPSPVYVFDLDVGDRSIWHEWSKLANLPASSKSSVRVPDWTGVSSRTDPGKPVMITAPNSSDVDMTSGTDHHGSSGRHPAQSSSARTSAK